MKTMVWVAWALTAQHPFAKKGLIMEDMSLYEDIECEEWYTEEGWDIILGDNEELDELSF